MEFDELLITTGVDGLVRLVKQKQRIELEDTSSMLNIPQETLEDWARVLEEEGIIRIEYRLTKIYLVWVKPTLEEIEGERESFYEEKEDIKTQVEQFREKMGKETQEVKDLQKSFAQFYLQTHKKMQELEKIVAPLPAAKTISEGVFVKGEDQIEDIEAELDEAKASLGDIKEELGQVGVGKEVSPSKEWIDKMEALSEELGEMQKGMSEMRQKAARETPKDVSLPSVREIKAKFDSMKKEFAQLRSRNVKLKEDMVSLHESSEILHEVAESIMGQEEKIEGLHKEVVDLSAEADKLAEKANKVAGKVKQNAEIADRLGDSVTVAKGILKRFPTQKKVMEEIEALRQTEEALVEKEKSLEKIFEAVGGRQVTAKKMTELMRQMDDKAEQMRRDLDSLETALQDEKGTYLTFQKIKERIVPSINAYDRKLKQMEDRITKIRGDAISEKESLKEDAAKIQESLKGDKLDNVMKLAEEIRKKRRMLDEIKKSMNNLVTISDNLNKRITLLSREANLLEIRAGTPETAPSEKKRKEISHKLKLTQDEEREFRKKREELKKLIKTLWEE
jgi:chromosome segregation ATPase